MNREGTESSLDAEGPTSGGFSRRSMLTAGAWSVPVIALASAAPAAALSTPLVGSLNFTNFSVWFEWNDSGRRTGIAGCTVVFLTGATGATVSPVTLTMTVPAAGMSTAPAGIDGSGAGWTAAAGSISGGSITYPFTWSGSLTVPESAYSSLVTFHLPGESGANLIPPLDWSAVAIASGAHNAVALGTLAGLIAATALPTGLTVNPGILTAQGTDQLVWSGASIAYSLQPQPAVVEYIAVLRGPGGGALALLNDANLDVSTNATPLGTFTYNSTATTGGPLSQGSYYVELTVVAAGGVIRRTTSALNF